jgi:hypothetical protein
LPVGNRFIAGREWGRANNSSAAYADVRRWCNIRIEVSAKRTSGYLFRSSLRFQRQNVSCPDRYRLVIVVLRDDSARASMRIIRVVPSMRMAGGKPTGSCKRNWGYLPEATDELFYQKYELPCVHKLERI